MFIAGVWILWGARHEDRPLPGGTVAKIILLRRARPNPHVVQQTVGSVLLFVNARPVSKELGSYA